MVGEASNDWGGPYRECLDTIVKELQSNFLPVLMPSENQKSRHGQLQECWVLNPECQNAKMLRLFGNLLGFTVRTTSPLPLYLHPIIWKSIFREELTLDDLETVDLF